jgi:hypothetical protein
VGAPGVVLDPVAHIARISKADPGHMPTADTVALLAGVRFHSSYMQPYKAQRNAELTALTTSNMASNQQ